MHSSLRWHREFDIQYTGVMPLSPEEGKHSDRRRVRRGMTVGELVVLCSLDKQQKSRGHHLVRLVEKQTEVGEDHPELLPAVAVLELPQ